MFFPRLRRHAKWMFVFLALVFGPRLRRASASAPAGSGSATSSAARAGRGSPSRTRSEETEENPKDPQAWRDLSTALQTEGETRGGDRRARHRRRARPEGRRARSGSSPASTSRSRRERQQDAQLLQAVAVYRAPSQLFPGLLGDGRRSRSSPTRSRHAIDGSVSRARHGGAPGREHAGDRRRSTPTSGSSPSSRTTRTSSSSSRRRPSRRATRRPRSPRTSGSSKLAPDDPSAPIVKRAAEAAPRSPLAGRRWIDSRAREARPTSFPPRRRTRAPSRSSRSALVVARSASPACGDTVGYTEGSATGSAARSCSSRAAAAATRSPTPGRPARSARTSTTRSSSRASTGSATDTIQQVVRDQIAYPVDRRRPTDAPGMPRGHLHGPGRARTSRPTSRRSRASTRTASRSTRANPPKPKPRRRAATTRRQGDLRLGRLRRLPHARRRRLDGHGRPEPRRGQAERTTSRSTGSRTARAGCRLQGPARARSRSRRSRSTSPTDAGK